MALEQDGNLLPGVAQVAIQGGRRAARRGERASRDQAGVVGRRSRVYRAVRTRAFRLGTRVLEFRALELVRILPDLVLRPSVPVSEAASAAHPASPRSAQSM